MSAARSPTASSNSSSRCTTVCSRSLDVSRLESLEANLASQKVTGAITEILNEEGRLLTDADRCRLIEEIKNELLGLGPLEPLLWDDSVTDILVNGAHPGLRRAAAAS